MAGKDTINGKLIRIYCCFAIPLFLIFAGVNWVGVHTMEQQLLALDQDSLNASAGQLENRLTAIGDHVRTFCALERDITAMQYAGTDLERLFASNRLITRMKNDALLYPMMLSEFIFGPQTGVRLIVYGDETNFDQRQTARRAVEALCGRMAENDETLYTGGWQRYDREGEAFLLYLYRTDDACMGFLIRAQELLNVSVLPASGSEHCVELCFRGEPVAAAGTLPQGQRLKAPIGDTQWSLVLSVVRRGLSDPNFWLRGLLCILPPFLLAVIWLLYRFTVHNVIAPIQSIAAAMRQAGGGDLQARVDTAGMVRELSLMGEVFNDTLARIDALQKREQENIREREKVQLCNLQLQINPHFLGNCFNAIYNAALNEKSAQLLELVTYLSRYFRYMACMERELVTLEDELGFTRDFLEIQKIRFGAQVDYQIQTPEYVKQLSVPPSCIKTFAENAVQHCRKDGACLRIRIRAELRQTENAPPRLRLAVCDNGPGFSPALLTLLAQEGVPRFDGRAHLGIANVRQRLALLYHGAARLTLENAPEGGAHVEVELPISHHAREDEV